MIIKGRYRTIRVKLSFKKTGVALLLGIFLITKVMRGVTISAEAGGIWNYISFLFIGYGAAALLKIGKQVMEWGSVFLPFLLFTLFSFYFSLVQISGFSIAIVYNLVAILYPFFLMCGFYYYGKKYGLFANKRVLVLIYYVIAVIIIYQAALFRNNSRGRIAVSDVYYILGLLPLMLIYTPPRLSIISILGAFLSLLLTGKRAGFLAILSMLIVYYFILARQKGGVSGYLKMVVSIAFIGAILYFTMTYLNERYNLQVLERLARLSTDGGSDRDIRWVDTWNAIKESNAIQLFIGHGDNSLSKVVGGHAHNDFLEVLFEYGAVAFMFYVSFYIALIKLAVKMIRWHYPYAAHFASSIIFALFIANFSFFVIEPTYITCSSVIWGLLLADWREYQLHKNSLEVGPGIGGEHDASNK